MYGRRVSDFAWGRLHSARVHIMENERDYRMPSKRIDLEVIRAVWIMNGDVELWIWWGCVCMRCDKYWKMKCVFTAKLSTGIFDENLFKHLRGMNSICIRQTTYRLICVKQIVSLVFSSSAYRSAFTGCLRLNGCLSLTEFGFLFGFTTYRGSQ